MYISIVFLLTTTLILVNSTVILPINSVDPLNEGYGLDTSFTDEYGLRRRCPVCDPSVYTYCSEKLFHDSCCCHNPNNPYDHLPYQCKFADCSFLHANSCHEHKLITACCCTKSFL